MTANSGSCGRGKPLRKPAFVSEAAREVDRKSTAEVVVALKATTSAHRVIFMAAAQAN